jgi:predicted ATP-dependent protease
MSAATDPQFLATMKARIAADPAARFAVSLDRLAYAKDNHALGTDLVRTYVRNVDLDELPETEAADVRQLRRGMNALTGRAKVLDTRYGDLAVAVRDAGGTVFDWVDETEARAVVARISASDNALSMKIADRAAVRG